MSNNDMQAAEGSVEDAIGAREAARVQMEEQVQAFLSKGGEIQAIDAHVTADPPQKPTNNYCSRPI